MKKQLIISAVALALTSTSLVAYSADDGARLGHRALPAQHPTSNVASAVALRNGGSIMSLPVSGEGSELGRATIGVDQTVGAMGAVVRNAVSGLSSELGLPSYALSGLSVQSVKVIANHISKNNGRISGYDSNTGAVSVTYTNNNGVQKTETFTPVKASAERSFAPTPVSSTTPPALGAAVTTVAPGVGGTGSGYQGSSRLGW